jgi:hypothetical protein
VEAAEVQVFYYINLVLFFTLLNFVSSDKTAISACHNKLQIKKAKNSASDWRNLIVPIATSNDTKLIFLTGQMWDLARGHGPVSRRLGPSGARTHGFPGSVIVI